MLIHSVIFWLKQGLREKERLLFKNEIQALEKIPSVDQLFLGQPAATTKRPVIDDSYDFCLTVILKDINAHDSYQDDPMHLEFIKKCSHMWERVKIYDAE